LANGSYYQARSGLSPPSCCPCWAHIKIRGAYLAPPIFSIMFLKYLLNENPANLLNYQNSRILCCIR